MSEPRHILSLSGGKDSAALALYMRDRVSNMEYIFNDTGKELPETYEYLDRIGDYLGRPVTRLNADKGFDHWYQLYGGMIPSNHRRWCTKMLKLKPFEVYVGTDPVVNYVGIRADEDRQGYISTKPNITPAYPFIEDGLVYADIVRILHQSGVGMPPYTRWGRTRSGCFFCFYQQKIEWVRLLETYPDLFDEAAEYEKEYLPTGNLFTWSNGEKLADLRKPERVAQIKADSLVRSGRTGPKDNMSLADVFRAQREPVIDDGCVVCTV
ncbi:phosphoadenosine phosphosulfate reductase [Xanthomonas perforans]|uniref:Phosphoadenosine phosphosulfate reductase n=1 Tax=Xanthomonas perforans TaxID=442694 RepID=A0ABR5EMC5_XANPE|nr:MULTISPECIES: phosphoadenosine phosphosulfate reductase family protein [Xanthomonas]KLC02021.1 phosphoadenosine phosphosulfate reductase [Xanthomonas perforans]KLC12631.1 phosphoadenosine phosphosulfate reductase [Xanthomonas perforans]KLC22686.1 phosphoadenosine phosphosulfate reductase [Xanthomonas perforans]KLC24433.1 phosphoadenosine phosphosulfate reductase [Xanthomonas perforans]KLC29248.1 phosphoadenosine phosphosulfate reductase [Xanthomonas perforans]